MTLVSTQPLMQWVPGSLASGVKRLGREVNYFLRSSAELKNTWVYALNPPYLFIVSCFIQRRDNFTFSWNMKCVMHLRSCELVGTYATDVERTSNFIYIHIKREREEYQENKNWPNEIFRWLLAEQLRKNLDLSREGTCMNIDDKIYFEVETTCRQS
jgi:hypothetical protein